MLVVLLAALAALAGAGCAKQHHDDGPREPAGGPGVYVADERHGRLIHVDSDLSGQGFSSYAPSGAVLDPSDVFIDAGGRIYVTDLSGRIGRMDDMAGRNAVWFGSPGSGVGEFSRPYGIFVDAADRIYVADSDNGRIVRMDDMTGAGWTTYGSYKAVSPGIGEFTQPFRLYVDSAGAISITDAVADRVVRIDDMTGTGWKSYGAFGTGAAVGEFLELYGIWLDASHRIYLCDSGHNRVVRIDDMTGANWTTLAVPSGERLEFATAIHVSHQSGRIFVGDGSRIVRVDDLSGHGWRTYGGPGAGDTPFRCYGMFVWEEPYALAALERWATSAR